VPDRVKLSFVIFDIRALWRSGSERQSAQISKITNDGSTWSARHRMLYICMHMATVCVKGLSRRQGGLCDTPMTSSISSASYAPQSYWMRRSSGNWTAELIVMRWRHCARGTSSRHSSWSSARWRTINDGARWDACSVMRGTVADGIANTNLTSNRTAGNLSK